MPGTRTMNAKGKRVCWECGRERDRCRAITVHKEGEIEWVCPQCFRNLEYDKYLYEYKQNCKEEEQT